jgi:hypothetical protein
MGIFTNTMLMSEWNRAGVSMEFQTVNPRMGATAQTATMKTPTTKMRAPVRSRENPDVSHIATSEIYR